MEKQGIYSNLYLKILAYTNVSGNIWVYQCGMFFNNLEFPCRRATRAYSVRLIYGAHRVGRIVHLHTKETSMIIYAMAEYQGDEIGYAETDSAIEYLFEDLIDQIPPIYPEDQIEITVWGDGRPDIYTTLSDLKSILAAA